MIYAPCLASCDEQNIRAAHEGPCCGISDRGSLKLEWFSSLGPADYIDRPLLRAAQKLHPILWGFVLSLLLQKVE